MYGAWTGVCLRNRVVGARGPVSPGRRVSSGGHLLIPVADLEDRARGKGLLGAVDISPDIGGQNVLRTFETAIRHNRRPTRTELERVLCRWVYFHLRSKIFSVSLTVGGSPPAFLLWICHCPIHCQVLGICVVLLVLTTYVVGVGSDAAFRCQ